MSDRFAALLLAILCTQGLGSAEHGTFFGPAPTASSPTTATLRFAPDRRVELVGAVRTAGTSSWKEFKGVPYAMPPVADLRWRPPAPWEPNSEQLAAMSFGASCPQTPQPDYYPVRAGGTHMSA